MYVLKETLSKSSKWSRRSQGYLEWGEFSDVDGDSRSNVGKEDGKSTKIEQQGTSIHQLASVSLEISKSADVLIAADVVYNPDAIPALSRAVERLLSHTDSTCTLDSSHDVPIHEKIAIFATNFRNADTFAFFESEISGKGIECIYASRDELDAMPNIFPCYFFQPRTDVRICIMKVKDIH